jgi:flagellar hook protein FlgE
MIRALSTAVSGLQYHQSRLDVVGNNIANVNTVGFRGSRLNGGDSFAQTLTGLVGTIASSQMGSGVSSTGITSSFTQGSINPTNQPYDMAIDGNGYFVVRNSATQESFATRAGDFRLDSEGYLSTAQGLRVQGYIDGSGTTVGDVRIDLTLPNPLPPEANPNNIPATEIRATGWRLEPNGEIRLTLNTGANLVRGQVLLQNFSDPNALTKAGSNLYGNLSAAGPLANPSVPGLNGTGQIRWQALEQSNIDLATQFTDLITTQRGYQANAKIITTSDEILQELINLKR